MKNFFILIIAAALLIFLFWLGTRIIYREKSPDASDSLPVDSRKSRKVDYAIYDQLLRKYVSGGRIDYLAWKKNDFAIFDKYIRSLKYAELANTGIEQKKAFWINAYNALTIYAVLKRIPANRLLAKSFSVQAVSGFFDKREYEVAGESLTLNDIENQKLRAGFHDPRIHFAIVCASTSCPEIQNSVFWPDGLELRLNKAARVFMQDVKKNRLDKEKGILYLSKIFRWFESDFINRSGSVKDFVKDFLGKRDAEYLSGRAVKIKYLFYNWLLNIKG